jgi:hypothetical protein
MQTIAAAKESHERFLKRIVESECVWCLRGDNGVAFCESNDSEERAVLQFWSDAAYAKRAMKDEWADYTTEEIALFDFLYRWIPGMHNDEVLVGTNWSGDLVGLEIEPADLQTDLRAAMGAEMLARYQKKLKEDMEKEKTQKPKPGKKKRG